MVAEKQVPCVVSVLDYLGCELCTIYMIVSLGEVRGILFLCTVVCPLDTVH